jgi:hypothetical protein
MSLRTADGWYEPGFFYIGINSDEKIFNAITGNTGTFIHEYIHFLQDITLPYLLRQSGIFYRSFSYVLDAIRRGVFRKPFEDWDEDTRTTNLQREYTLGQEHSEYTFDKITSIRKDYFNNNNIHNVYKYYIDIDDNNAYQVGAADFYEYIAAKIEKKFFNKDHIQLPYNTMDYLFDFYELSDIPDESRLYIAEYCLYNDNPIHFFCQFVMNIIKKNKENLIDYRKCKEFLARYGWSSRGHQDENIFIKADRRINESGSSLNHIFKKSLYPSVNRWINNMLDFSRNDLASRFIFGDLYCLDKNKFESAISLCINKVGIPLVFNRNNDLFSWLPENEGYNYCEFINLYIINQFMRFIGDSASACPISSFCSGTKQYKIDDHCFKIENIKPGNHPQCFFYNFLDRYRINI